MTSNYWRDRRNKMISQCLFISKPFLCSYLLIAASCPLFSQALSPKSVATRFCDLDTQGEQLSPEGWAKIAALFVTPGSPKRDRITVVRDFVIGDPDLSSNNGKAELYLEYVELGRIDRSSASFSSLPGMTVRVLLDLVRVPVRGSGERSGPEEPSANWLIVGSVPEPRLTVANATRYASEVLKNAKNEAEKKNAERLFAALRRLR
jgi:hypothetical protein